MGRGYTKSFLSRGFQIWWNKHYHSFPINWGNQTKYVPSVETNFCKSFMSLCHIFSIIVPTLDNTDSAPKWHFLWTSSWTKCQKKVQQYNEVDNMYILCFKDRAVFSLNTAVASSGIIPALSWYTLFILCIIICLYLYTCKLFLLIWCNFRSTD